MTTFIVIGMMLVLIADGFLSSGRSVLGRIHSSRHLHTLTEVSKRADRVINLLAHYSKVDTGLMLLQMICRFLAVGFLVQLFGKGESLVWTWWITLSLVGMAILLGALEWAASLVNVKDPENWALGMSGLLLLLYKISLPVVFLLFLFTGDLEETQRKFDLVSEEELINLVDESHKDGLLEKEERKMIHSVFRLDDTLTREIMVPRVDILAIDAEIPLASAVKHFVESGYSRIPVYKENVDNILGLLYAKDLLEICGNGTNFQGEIAELVREAYFVPESLVVNELFSDMQRKRIHFAIVVDEYGGVAGIVTLEDIIEEIFGEIQDEYDEEENLYLTVGPGEYIFQGRIDIDDLNLILDSSLPSQEADTLGGLVYCELGHVPQQGEVVKLDDLVIKVEQVEEHRINKVRIKKLSNISEAEENKPDDSI